MAMIAVRIRASWGGSACVWGQIATVNSTVLANPADGHDGGENTRPPGWEAIAFGGRSWP